MRTHGEVMDPAIASLLEDLSVSGRIDKTLVVILSEFGRTPRINQNGGRDHWAKVFTCFMAGGGVNGGTVIGSSDKDGAMPDENPVQVSDLHASILHAIGIDPAHEITTPQGRPMTLVRKGARPIQGLFA